MVTKLEFKKFMSESLEEYTDDVWKQSQKELINKIDLWIDKNVNMSGDMDCGAFME